jgi:hypothetical protein
MNTDAVIGCDAVDAGDAWLRLKTASGVVRTIPWTSIKMAGMGGNHEGEITIGGVTEKTAPYYRTHNSLWVIYAEGGVAQIMLEKSSPKRDAIIAGFAKQLGDNWLGDRLSGSNLMGAMFTLPKKMSGLIPKLVTITFAIMLGLILIAVIAGYLAGRSS